MKKIALPIVLVSFLLFSCLASAQEPAENYAISPVSSKIKVDGLLDEDAWAKATVIKLPYEWTPGDNIPSPVETECLVTFDRDGFYLAFRCFDPKPGEIRAHLMDRDATDTLIQDDHIRNSKKFLFCCAGRMIVQALILPHPIVRDGKSRSRRLSN